MGAKASACWVAVARGTLDARREQVALTFGAQWEMHLGSQVAGLRGTCGRAVCESVMSAMRGT